MEIKNDMMSWTQYDRTHSTWLFINYNINNVSRIRIWSHTIAADCECLSELHFLFKFKETDTL